MLARTFRFLMVLALFAPLTLLGCDVFCGCWNRRVELPTAR